MSKMEKGNEGNAIPPPLQATAEVVVPKEREDGLVYFRNNDGTSWTGEPRDRFCTA